jgi:hypothetical protein
VRIGRSLAKWPDVAGRVEHQLGIFLGRAIIGLGHGQQVGEHEQSHLRDLGAVGIVPVDDVTELPLAHVADGDAVLELLGVHGHALAGLAEIGCARHALGLLAGLF